MKKIFFAVVAVVAMASCSKDEVLELNREQIGFGEAFVENSTRATDKSYTDDNPVKAFRVWGTVTGKHTGAKTLYIFNGDDVKNTNGTTTVGYDDVWFCDNVQYWVPNANYNFIAVVDGAYVPASNTIAYTVADQKDLLLATATASVANDGTVTGSHMGDNGLVKFQFNHLLSKAYFTFKTKTNFQTDAYTYEISNVKFNSAYTSGDYTVGDDWDATGDAALSFGAAVTLNPSKTEVVSVTSEYAKLFIPQQNLKASFTVTMKYGGESVSVKNYEFDVFATKSVAGHQYNFVVEFAENNTIKFTVDDATDWTNNDTVINVQ